MNLQKLLLQGLIWRGLYFISLLLVNVFISRYLQASLTGWVYYISNIFSVSLIAAGVSMDSAINYFAPDAKIQRNKIAWLAGLWSIVTIILSAAVVFIYLLFESDTVKIQAANYYFFGACYFAGIFLYGSGASLYYSQNNYWLPNLLLSSLNFLLILLIPKTINATNVNEALPVLHIYFLNFFLQGFLVWLVYMIQSKFLMKLQMPAAAEMKFFFKYAVTAMAGNMIFFLVYRIDYLFVNASPVCTSADLGNYIQVSKLGQMLLIIPQIIASVIFPRTASGEGRKELHASLMILARLFSQLYLLILLVTIFFGHEIFTWLFGETFNEMQLPFIILVPGIFFLSVLQLLSAYFGGKGKIRVNLYGALIALLIVVAGDYLFVPRYGIVAAAAVSTAGYAVNMAYPLYVFYKDYSISFIEFFRWRMSDYVWLKELFAKSELAGLK
ncbi:MAG TPA: polysaccharide biosynthesis C-terminal domain-containing protein [Chitinophagaceae bacterium]|nr:polysaccharide biosynthesis C-terminal domain-containing protein [Chitinophagaceae bacterium]